MAGLYTVIWMKYIAFKTQSGNVFGHDVYLHMIQWWFSQGPEKKKGGF
jgi:hypothetical protein